MLNEGRLKLHQQFVSQIVLVLTCDKGGDGVAATTKLGLVIGNVEHPNSPKNLSILGIFFGNDDRTNLENKFSSIFAQKDLVHGPPLVNIALADVVPPNGSKYPNF
ncbi:hypothetical protein niasHT_031441 [Heterodera trifolii]|uniref:Uncharacterized protein n=1 Tax=Heterodera trifolii TaxID=157864 RepID=A0ABD2HQ48_9BILA